MPSSHWAMMFISNLPLSHWLMLSFTYSRRYMKTAISGPSESSPFYPAVSSFQVALPHYIPRCAMLLSILKASPNFFWKFISNALCWLLLILPTFWIYTIFVFGRQLRSNDSVARSHEFKFKPAVWPRVSYTFIYFLASVSSSIK